MPISEKSSPTRHMLYLSFYPAASLRSNIKNQNLVGVSSLIFKNGCRLRFVFRFTTVYHLNESPFQNRPIPEAELPPHEQYVVDVLLNCAKGSTLPQDRDALAIQTTGIEPCPPGQKGQPIIVPVLLSTIESISSLRLFVPKDLRQESAREHLWKSVLEVQGRFPNGITLLDPVQHMGIQDHKFKDLVKVSACLFGSILILTALI